MKDNVSIIVEQGSCVGCCECLSACSRNNIYIVLDHRSGRPVPMIDEGCKHCGDCLSACSQVLVSAPLASVI